MAGYETTKLWRQTLEAQASDDEPVSRQRLHAAYLSFRKNSAVLASEVAHDLRQFTVHDATHLDALWETADLIIGNVQINPVEAFVLGGSFLIHDLGMGLASYPGGINDLRALTAWPDLVAAAAHQILGRVPRQVDLTQPSSEIERLAMEIALRELHAKHAEELAMVAWESAGVATHLIEDVGLREAYGPVIGRIAHSHWWPVSELPGAFPSLIGAQVDFPQDWIVDPFKLACLLRLADASHLDSRRAPRLLRAVRRPTGIADQHWGFQTHLHQVQLRDDRLFYSTGHAFTIEEADSWWLCLDSLRMVDSELRGVDALLADRGAPRFAAHSVFGVDDPTRLMEAIPTRDWLPVDANVRINDVPALVTKLGGRELYGDSPQAAVRELVQNAADAARARSTLDPEMRPTVIIRLEERADGTYLEVRDNGLGMSQAVLTGALLDFGKSFWGSDLMRDEFPGLLASSYRSVGKYGIGFFSVFMLGDRVQVASRRFDMGAKDTMILEFRNGLEARPLLREATHTERLSNGGTRVVVRLHKGPHSPGGLLFSVRGRTERGTLRQLIELIAPAASVDIQVQELVSDKRELVITANDWLTINNEDLFERLYGHLRRRSSGDISPSYISAFVKYCNAITAEDGTVLGRAVVIPHTRSPSQYFHAAAVLTIGGLRACDMSQISGILVAEPMRAARDDAHPVVRKADVSRWATAQLAAMSVETFDILQDWELTQIAHVLGADVSSRHVAFTGEGPKSQSDLHAWCASRSRVAICLSDVDPYLDEHNALIFYDRRRPRPTGVVKPDGNAVFTDYTTFFTSGSTSHTWLEPWNVDGFDEGSERDQDYPENLTPELLAGFWQSYHEHRLPWVVLKTVADAWGSTPEALLLASFRASELADTVAVAHSDSGEAITSGETLLLTRPETSQATDVGASGV